MTIKLFKRDKGTHTEYFKKTASVDFTKNDLVAIQTTGYIARSVDGSTLTNIGLVQESIASTDATNKELPVLIPGPDAIFICDVSTGTAAVEDIGQWIDIDDHNSVDVDASSYGVFQIVGIISATKVLAKLARKNGPLGT
jgi:hypothetical protein